MRVEREEEGRVGLELICHRERERDALGTIAASLGAPPIRTSPLNRGNKLPKLVTAPKKSPKHVFVWAATPVTSGHRLLGRLFSLARAVQNSV